MYKNLVIVLALWGGLTLQAKDPMQRFPKSRFSIQTAGSIGFMSLGYSRLNKRENLEIGAMAGFLPPQVGKPEMSLSIKADYKPLSIHIEEGLNWRPITLGVFICRHFGKDHSATWGNQYPYKYYWWNRSTRTHVFAATELSYSSKKSCYIKNLTLYLEANTNDLYLYSYLPNTKSLSLYDIIFLGAGLKISFRK